MTTKYGKKALAATAALTLVGGGGLAYALKKSKEKADKITEVQDEIINTVTKFENTEFGAKVSKNFPNLFKDHKSIEAKHKIQVDLYRPKPDNVYVWMKKIMIDLYPVYTEISHHFPDDRGTKGSDYKALFCILLFHVTDERFETFRKEGGMIVVSKDGKTSDVYVREMTKLRSETFDMIHMLRASPVKELRFDQLDRDTKKILKRMSLDCKKLYIKYRNRLLIKNRVVNVVDLEHSKLEKGYFWN